MHKRFEGKNKAITHYKNQNIDLLGGFHSDGCGKKLFLTLRK